jgi:hypothetical protein
MNVSKEEMNSTSKMIEVLGKDYIKFEVPSNTKRKYSWLSFYTLSPKVIKTQLDPCFPSFVQTPIPLSYGITISRVMLHFISIKWGRNLSPTREP